MKLPDILAGPILRRVDKKEINIWIATSQPFEIEAELYETSRNTEDHSFQYSLLNNQSISSAIQMGKNLFIYLIKIEPEGSSFPTQTLLAYNLFFLKGSKLLDLGTLGLLTPDDPNSIVYGGLRYPSFFINNEMESIVLYGSCRKPHGSGEDALASGDETIRETYLNLKKRPCALFLVGDQIYADDIADPIAPYLFKLGQELIGDNESSLLELLDQRLAKDRYQSNLYKIQARKPIMNDLCQFTSRNSDNHLITFGEYAAMYLLNWSPEIWKLFDKKEFKNRLPKGQYFPRFSKTNESDRIGTYRDTRKERTYKEQEKHVEKFRRSLPHVRRLLANIPTYMLFDDHDLTDDWNISSEWKRKVWEAPLGRHVIANGLAAYWAFQGWGNNPTGFNQTFLKTMKKHFSSKKFKRKAYNKWVDLLWGYNSWSFIAPTTPTTVFLDTRTQRNYQEISEQKSFGNRLKQTIEGPELVSQEAWKFVTKQLNESGWRSESPLIVVSPGPFYGIDLIETFLHRYISPLKLIGMPVKTFFDMEAWRYNGRGFTNFLQTIRKWNPSTCIILSGDAHIASSAVSHIKPETDEEMTIVQFTSSPLKNPSFSGVPGILLKEAVWLFENTTKNHVVHRGCDSDYSLYHSKVQNKSNKSKFIWSEEIRYLPIETGSLIKTKNNLGLINFNDWNIENRFLERKKTN